MEFDRSETFLQEFLICRLFMQFKAIGAFDVNSSKTMTQKLAET